MEEVGVGCQINTLMVVEVPLQMQLHSQSPFWQILEEERRNGKYEPSWLNSLVQAMALVAVKSCCVRSVPPMGMTA